MEKGKGFNRKDVSFPARRVLLVDKRRRLPAKKLFFFVSQERVEAEERDWLEMIISLFCLKRMILALKWKVPIKKPPEKRFKQRLPQKDFQYDYGSKRKLLWTTELGNIFRIFKPTAVDVSRTGWAMSRVAT